jgi:predicted dehydrogenase
MKVNETAVISHQYLSACKHFYSEKPLAMFFDGAKILVDLAKEKTCKLSQHFVVF